jgi:ATP-dependent helicase/nuclease subunit A
MSRRDDATERQVQAANPALSTWLSANAGSGKTRVLTDRVARMLLSGVDPGKILCLTYTKAAATEMQNRLFARLGDWAMKEDAALRGALQDLGVEDKIDAARMARARQLFARAIETPGGLRIQTIHSFCASLLRRFPLEAGVSPQFTEMDDRASALLRDDLLNELAESLAPDVILDLAKAYTGEDFSSLAAEVCQRRADFQVPKSDADCLALFGLLPDASEARLLGDVLLGGEEVWLAQVIADLAKGSANDVKAAEKLSKLDLTQISLNDIAVFEDVFLTGAKAAAAYCAKVGSFPTKDTRARMGDILDRLNALMGRVEQGREPRLAFAAAKRTACLHRFAAALLPQYEARKAARGLLDFDDLITRAKALLTDPRVAQWVLFRLDGGIDHILVDEAQDTSPDQWKVIELLADEFTSGRSARTEARTIFVVGDKKQSIYSFQGAEVAAFDVKRALFRDKLAAVQSPLQDMVLAHSFRSSPTILRLVDLTFDERRQAGLGGEVKHIAFKADMPGRVDLWPVFEPAESPEEPAWYDPVDLRSDAHHSARLGRAVATQIAAMIASGVQIMGKRGFRPVHAGDFLILVRRRSPIFEEVISACKSAGLPIAGADRLKLGAVLAVKDITALLSFLATPEDDLALATCLRSPLFGWTEQQIYALAQPRKGYLWEALRADEAQSATRRTLSALLDTADFLRPYDLIERVLTRFKGRQNLLARLGADAEDGIDELLNQALAYERAEVPSLTGFLGWLEADDVQVKRQMDSAGDKIRVMTVHGAKGLEAPIVILPDTATHRPQDSDEIYALPEGPVWKTVAEKSPSLIAAAQLQRRQKDEEEALRLLYVAMTRAQSWLIVAAAGNVGKNETGNKVWYQMIRDALLAAGAVGTPEGGLTLCDGDWPLPIPSGPQTGAAPPPPLPEWVRLNAPDAPRPTQPLTPSGLGGAKALAGDLGGDEGTAEAMARGTRLHLLLEHLPNHPAGQWGALAAALLPNAADGDALLAEAARVVSALPEIFTAEALTEVDLTASAGPLTLNGTVDRLIVTPTRVLAVDFKSNQLVPETIAAVPEGLLRQMGAYDHALRQIYPDRQIEVALLWTATAQLMPLAPDIVRLAWGRATLP